MYLHRFVEFLCEVCWTVLDLFHWNKNIDQTFLVIDHEWWNTAGQLDMSKGPWIAPRLPNSIMNSKRTSNSRKIHRKLYKCTDWEEAEFNITSHFCFNWLLNVLTGHLKHSSLETLNINNSQLEKFCHRGGLEEFGLKLALAVALYYYYIAFTGSIQLLLSDRCPFCCMCWSSVQRSNDRKLDSVIAE